ncbi:benzoate transporter [Clostridium baratii]|uniref:Small, acid-soluble spore s, alpha/beta type family protein n=3 Tax=Clostridium TaxID=1485 RepID=A0A0A7FVQ4_9CLOT|nr:small, acid-soluble spore protein, alpha/beta type [Clostridium baratii]AIY83663.1 small, acid-soluble spore s, alpha/beta type family protein [Clostridium baratii str. Sullivan]KJU71272.1 benzoate transporter [Clostridium baratii]MBS6006634.1 small, acid-soluble spore protein, alpha/beta type [Clostridium baratii]MBS6043524.1 small, acid-soluble spore protein, alpha/beta type [Clostridium baratii]MDU1053693.1 small, acid-soluble spore protein, alpha/beta type [Clostridium baratii]
MSKTPLKKIIKSKLKSNKELTEAEKLREKIKYEIAEELGLSDKIDNGGWGALTAEETGRIGGIMTSRKKKLNIPTNDVILGRKKLDETKGDNVSK